MNFTRTNTYDERDRLITQTDPTGVYLDSGNTLEYSYDLAGNRTSVTTPSGTVYYTFDEWNRLKTVTDADNHQTIYVYDGVSNLIETTFSNGVIETRNYDELNRLIKLENKLGEQVISGYEYTLDKVGDRLKVEEADGRIVEYEYDDLYRLIEEIITDSSDTVNDGRVIGYTYDAVGNRLTKVDSIEGTTTYVYNANDWLLTETKDNGEVKEYEYDNNGNTIKTIEGTAETLYEWDKENRLVSVTLSDGTEINYEYDVNNIRTSQEANGVRTDYLVDSNQAYAQVLEEYVDGELEVSYVYGLDLISQERNDETTFYQVDGLGSARVLTNENGLVISSYDYDAFGNLINSNSNIDNNYLFAGEQFDDDLGEYYLRQRYYNQEVGRFTRRDTYEGRISEPITLHKYLYGNANPVVYVDSTGLYSIAEAQAASSIANTLNEIQFSSGQNFFFAALNNEEPTPRSIGLGILFDLTLLTIIPAAVLAIPVAYENVVRRGVGGLIRKSGLTEIGVCDQCAFLVKKSLIKEGINGRYIRVETSGTSGSLGRIWDDGTEQLIATNGYHEANIVNINGKEIVFDNVYPDGKEFQKWWNDLYVDHTPDNKPIIVRDELF
ncbi:papain fold toxin domain-containing protein [Crocosphaera sp. Alani8]|uniref:papain fold toxin domain-containing protein n=1 Tax=Crocosphaera sp. Alani8 TaxID=3038952 RepID=UPI00313E9247